MMVGGEVIEVHREAPWGWGRGTGTPGTDGPVGNGVRTVFDWATVADEVRLLITATLLLRPLDLTVVMEARI